MESSQYLQTFSVNVWTKANLSEILLTVCSAGK